MSPDALLARVLLGTSFVAAIAVLSLPQARAFSATLGSMPLWLLALPLSAWLALQLRRHLRPAPSDAAPGRHRRRAVAVPSRRRAITLPRDRPHRIRIRRIG